ncbi:hypothetical protein BP5796_11606 [Coleophoma crateriformis]|uniref:Uncharacterized protein n=1 Tax=Coleophoma crateriformis TaxID=565419 RepID=A0A3D8QEA9_9HELO|nr:hypothetical protein BP5796_11606 [Coleophoma crateriformis]
MVTFNASSNPPHHRQNRRRERPGSRTRRSLSRKSALQLYEYDESILEARDPTFPLPSDRAKPSPLLRQNFDQSWQRWKAREAEEKAAVELVRLQQEHEQRLFGGDVGDDQLHLSDILYDFFGEFNIVSDELPREKVSWLSLRQGRHRRFSLRRSLSSYFSLGKVSNDEQVSRFMSRNLLRNRPTRSTIQHRLKSSKFPTASSNSNISNSSRTGTQIQSLPHTSFSEQDDGTFITSNQPRTSLEPRLPKSSPPAKEPNPEETWTLIGDLKQTAHARPTP